VSFSAYIAYHKTSGFYHISHSTYPSSFAIFALVVL
jgi:hypothetical protein